MSPRPLITLLTDFGHRDAYAGILHGVISGICPQATIVDLSHEVPPQDVVAGGLILRSAVPYFPPGTIHVAIVDPGVGTSRAAVLVETRDAWLIGPDNGVLWPAAAELGIASVTDLAEPRYRLPRVSSTFHGRDVFAPAAAHLAAGVSSTAFGPRRSSLHELVLPLPEARAGGVSGSVIYVDHFGNLVTNVCARDLAAFSGTKLSVSIAECIDVPVVATYADVEPGTLAALVGSWGHLELALRDGSAAERTCSGVGAPILVRPV